MTSALQILFDLRAFIVLNFFCCFMKYIHNWVDCIERHEHVSIIIIFFLPFQVFIFFQREKETDGLLCVPYFLSAELQATGLIDT